LPGPEVPRRAELTLHLRLCSCRSPPSSSSLLKGRLLILTFGYLRTYDVSAFRSLLLASISSWVSSYLGSAFLLPVCIDFAYDLRFQTRSFSFSFLFLHVN
jgi:hypothetical protein